MDTAVGLLHQTMVVGGGMGAIVVTAVAVPDQAAFTALTVKYHVFQTPQTPTITVTQTVPQIGSMQLRVRGYDPYDAYLEEITPVFGITAKTSNHVYLGNIFRRVSEVAYIATGMSAAATISVGAHNDLRRLNTAAIEHVSPENLGFWLPGQRASENSTTRANGGECDPDEWGVRYVHGLNKTQAHVLLFKHAAEVVGYSNPGWGVDDEKIGFDFEHIESAFGSPFTYDVSDTVELYVASVSKPR